MTSKLNSAARLFRILDQAKSIPENTQAAEGWVKLLSIQEEHPLRRVIAITALTQGMHHEVQSAVAGLKMLNFPENLYERSFSRVENAISPMLLGQSWVHVRQYLTPETMTALAFCAQILPDEESQISLKEIEDILAPVLPSWRAV